MVQDNLSDDENQKYEYYDGKKNKSNSRTGKSSNKKSKQLNVSNNK